MFIVHDQHKLRALKLLIHEPDKINLQYLLKQLFNDFQYINNKNKDYHKVYMRFYRFFKQLQKNGLIELKKIDGLIWIKATNPKIIDLIRASEKIKPENREINSIFKLPKRSRPERIEAIKRVLQLDKLTPEQEEILINYFNLYLEDVKNRVIILKRRPEAPSSYPLFLKIFYNTRFTDKGYLFSLEEKYNSVWGMATRKYKKGVFLTLTTDPKRFKSLWHSWRHFAIATNRFLSYLTKYLKKRPRYISVYEFTKSGLLHIHIVIFGLSYLLGKDRITQEWERCGQGTINYIYSIKNNNNRWIWGRLRPKLKDRKIGVKEYLQKYLKKAFFEKSTLFLYWVSGKRFFSYSRVFNPVKATIVYGYGYFNFLGSWLEWEIPDFIFYCLIDPDKCDRPPTKSFNYFSFNRFHKFE